MHLNRFLLLGLLVIGNYLFGQDTLFFNNQTTVVAKIVEINPTQIKYKRLDNIDGPQYVVPKSDLNYVVYSTGLKESFAGLQYTNGTPQTLDNNGNNEYGKTGTSASGMIDARRYYNPVGGPIGTGVTAALCTPFCGLIPAIIISNNEPDPENLDMPKPESKTSEYKQAYSNQAYRIKRTKTWQAYGIGSAINIAFFVIVAVLSQ